MDKRVIYAIVAVILVALLAAVFLKAAVGVFAVLLRFVLVGVIGLVVYFGVQRFLQRSRK